MFWLEENVILSNVLITGESNFDENTTFKIGTLGLCTEWAEYKNTSTWVHNNPWNFEDYNIT